MTTVKNLFVAVFAIFVITNLAIPAIAAFENPEIVFEGMDPQEVTFNLVDEMGPRNTIQIIYRGELFFSMNAFRKLDALSWVMSQMQKELDLAKATGKKVNFVNEGYRNSSVIGFPTLMQYHFAIQQ